MGSISANSVLPAAGYLIGSGSAALYVSFRLTRRWTGDGLLRSLIGTVIALAQIVGVPLLLAMLGVLGKTGVLVGHLAIAGLVFAIGGGTRPREPEEERPRTRWTLSGLLATAGGVMLLAAAAVPTLRGIPTSAYDSREYHISAIANWLQNHNIWHLPFQNPGFYTAAHPGNGEMLGLWLSIPTHSDQLAYLATIPFAILLYFAMVSIARDLGGSPRVAALATLSLFATPVVFQYNVNSLQTDLAATGGIVAAVALFLKASMADERERVPLIGLAGLALGLSLGSKYTALVPGVVLLIGAVVFLRPRRSLWWVVPGILFFAAPWFIRNGLRTGNPLFPLDLEFAGAHLLTGGTSPLDFLKTTMAGHVRRADFGVLRHAAGVAARLFGPAGALAVVGSLVAVRPDPKRTARLVVAAFGFIGLIAYAVTPYTGAGPEGFNLLLEVNMRYALIGLTVLMAVAAAVLPYVVVAPIIAVAFGYDAWRIVHGLTGRPDIHYGYREGLVLVVIGLAAAGIASAWPRIARVARKIRARGTAASLLPAVAAIALLWLITAGTISHINGVTEKSALEAALDPYRSLGPIAALSVSDVRGAVGHRLDSRLIELDQDGDRSSLPFGNSEALTRALAASGARILIVDEAPSLVPSFPAGWKPPTGWNKVAAAGTTAVYVRSA